MAGGDCLLNVQELERAAAVFMAAPNETTAEHRKAAEAYFIQLRQSALPLHVCKQLLESTQSEVVIFQLVSAVRESTLRHWTVMQSSEIEAKWKCLFDFLLARPGLRDYLAAEILQTVAMVLKRGTFDTLCGDTDYFFSTVERLLNSSDAQHQSLGCQCLLSLCSEYSTSWRSSDVGMTWDFHMRAKRNFEVTQLKRVFEMAVQALLATLPAVDLTQRPGAALCGRFLGLAECVLAWHFGSRLLPRRLTYSMEFAPAAALRPPAVWRALLLEPTTLRFFFQLHAAVRADEQLCHSAMQCLIQLASLMGDVFAPSSPSQMNDPSTPQPQDVYVHAFVSHTLEHFSDMKPHELVNFATMVWKLLSYHPLPVIFRLPHSLLEPFISLLASLNCYVSKRTVQQIMAGVAEDEEMHCEALLKLFDCWTVMVRAEGRLIPDGLLMSPTTDILDSFLSGLLAPPLGTRHTAAQVADEQAEDDRSRYGDLLTSVGVFGRYAFSHTAAILGKSIRDLLDRFSQPNLETQPTALCALQEDLHWLLLVIGYTMAGEDCDGCSFVPPEFLELASRQTPPPDLDATRAFLAQCVDGNAVLPDDASRVDQILILVGYVFLWAVMEQRLLVGGDKRRLSPQLCSTTLWCVRRLTSAFTYTAVDPEYRSLLPRLRPLLTGSSDPDELPVFRRALETSTELSQAVVSFLLGKCFTSISAWSGERDVVRDAVAVLVSLVDKQPKANEVASSAQLLDGIGGLQLAAMTTASRKELLRALVLVGAATDDATLQQRMSALVLEPLAARFGQVIGASAALSSTADSHLVDLLECFGGVVMGTQMHSATFIFEYSMPIVEASVALLDVCKDRQPVVDGVLELFSVTASKLAVYMDSRVATERFYRCLLQLLATYSKTQLAKYSTKDIEEEKASDLLLLFDVLSNVLSKDILVLAGIEGSDGFDSGSAAKVALSGLEMLMPLMDSDVLRFPTLCHKFYRLLVYICEMYPETVCALPQPMLGALLNCARLGLSSQYGGEVMQHSLTLVGQLATFVCQSQLDSAPSIKHALTGFTREAFECCLQTSSELDVFGEAVFTLYSLISCDQNVYNEMVASFIGAHAEATVQQRLTTAFNELLPPATAAVPLRREKRAFRDRFDVFLSDIQGLLCINRT